MKTALRENEFEQSRMIWYLVYVSDIEHEMRNSC
jgi:hypothetical protein